MITKALIPLVGVALIFMLAACRRDVAVYDGFETPELSSLWETKRFLPGAVQIQSSVVRAGKGAARITLRPGDQIPQEKGSQLERAELQEPRRFWAAEDSSHVYLFSMFVPQDFAIVPARLVIAQWKQNCPVDACAPDNPILAVRYESGELFITKQVAAEREVLYRTRDDIRNRWLDFKFQIRFSRNQNGRIRAWLGNASVIDYKGVTAYPESGGYAARGLFYFKVGLYRDRVSEPMTIYVDEYQKNPLLFPGPGGNLVD
jgi:hypothetical protein